MSQYAQTVCVIKEEELFTLLNLLRAAPATFTKRLEEHVSSLQEQIASPKSASRTIDDLTQALKLVTSAVHQIAEFKTSTRLHLSSGLCKAARDMVCSLGTFGFIAPVESSQLEASESREVHAVSSSFYPKYGYLKQLPVIEHFAYGFENTVEAICAIVTSRTADVNGDPKELTSVKVRVVGVAVGAHQSMKNCAVIVACGNYFEKQHTQALSHPIPFQSETEFFPLGFGKALLKIGPDAVRKFCSVLDEKGLKLADVLTPGANISREALETILSSYLTPEQVKWLASKLMDGQSLINYSYIESTLSCLRIRVYKENELTRSLLRVKTLIQDNLRISIFEAFHKMTPPEASQADGLTKEQIKVGLTSIGCFLPFHEVSEMLCAFDCNYEGFISVHNWVSVLCAVKPALKKVVGSPKSSPQPRPMKAISLLGNSLQTNQAFSLNSSILDPRLSSRPSTAGSFVTLHRNFSSAVSNPISEESGYISNASLSDASSLQPALDAQGIIQSVPGERLLQAAKVFTNFSSGATPIEEERKMRSLGSHVYSGPGRHHEVLGMMDSGGIVTVHKIASPWAKISIGELEGWVPLQHLDSTLDRRVYEGKDSLIQSFPVTEAKAVATVYLRKDPAWDGKAIKKIRPNELTEVLGANNDWLRVRTSTGYRGWIPQPSTNVSVIKVTTADSWTRESGFSAPTNFYKEENSPGKKTELQQWLEDMKPSVLPRENMLSVEARISAKIAALTEEQTANLQLRLKKKQFRERLIRMWMNLALTRAFT